ncbi:MAG: N-acetylmuramoyl-L-alanine amidase [Clostridia bacterium]
MKQHIAKLLVFFMLITTMIVPADLSFAESGNENTTQTEESNDPQKELDSTQETSAKSTDDEKSVENESSPNSSAAKESIIAAENDQLEETVTERMEFLYIESKELVAPGTQNIVVSWKEAIDDIQNMVLVYENEQGKTFTLKESKRNDESIVFTKDFTASEAGTYKIKGVQYFVGNEEKYFAFDDVEIAASFKVVKGEAIEDDAIAKVEVESDGTVDKKEVNGEIKDAVTSTDAAPKAQTKARRAKSSNIVVVLDPGHGGSDSGATRGSVYEKNINFKVAQYCKAELEQYCGVTVYMTRTGDTNPSLQERAQIAANYGANILVSIHQNSGSSSAYGAEVYYPNRNYKPAIGDSGKAVADSIQKELVSLGLSNRGTKIRNTANGSTYADGSYSDYYGIIRNSKNLGVPAIIVEHAFLSNASDYNNFLSSDSKLQKLGIADATGIAKAFGLSKGKWVDTENGRMYQFGDGTYARNQQIVLSGTVNQRCFYFDENGYLVKGIFQNKNNKVWYYADEETGGIRTEAGFVTWKGNRYYVTPGGAVAFNQQVVIDGKVNQRCFYFGENGQLVKGIFQNKNNKVWYYADEETGGIRTEAGFVTWKGNRYYVTPGGAVAFNQQVVIDGKVNQRCFYFGENGQLVKGIFQNKNNKVWYYADEETGGIRTEAGFVTWKGNRYYVTPGGAVAFNQQVVIDGKVNQRCFYFGENGQLVKGIFQNKNNKVWYYADEETGGIRTEAGFVTWKGNRYYVTPGGAVAFNQQVVIDGKVNQRCFYFGENGQLVKGIFQNKNNKVWYYADEETGGIRTEAGFVTWKGNRYYVTPGGAVAFNQQVVIDGKVNQRCFYFGENGQLVKGIFQNKNNKVWYYADEETGGIRTEAGFVTWKGNKYYVTPGGAIAVNQQIKFKDTIYSFDSSGKLFKEEQIGTLISGESEASIDAMVDFYKKSNKKYPQEIYASKGATNIEEFCQIYDEEATAEGIRAEVAFCQAMKETGWLQFGGDVKASQCNFAGIGATGGGVSGASFKDVRTGVRAQIQHLKAYANTLPLNNACVDPRFKYVKRGSAPYVEWLGKNANPNGVGWAPAANYGTSIVQMMNKLLSY